MALLSRSAPRGIQQATRKMTGIRGAELVSVRTGLRSGCLTSRTCWSGRKAISLRLFWIGIVRLSG